MASHAIADHKILPRPGSAYSMTGPNTGLLAILTNPHHYPVEALCSCGMVIRCEQGPAAEEPAEWRHTGRRPGDPR